MAKFVTLKDVSGKTNSETCINVDQVCHFTILRSPGSLGVVEVVTSDGRTFTLKHGAARDFLAHVQQNHTSDPSPSP